MCKANVLAGVVAKMLRDPEEDSDTQKAIRDLAVILFGRGPSSLERTALEAFAVWVANDTASLLLQQVSEEAMVAAEDWHLPNLHVRFADRLDRALATVSLTSAASSVSEGTGTAAAVESPF